MLPNIDATYRGRGGEAMQYVQAVRILSINTRINANYKMISKMAEGNPYAWSIENSSTMDFSARGAIPPPFNLRPFIGMQTRFAPLKFPVAGVAALAIQCPGEVRCLLLVLCCAEGEGNVDLDD
jgi:hypothetical protein